jgi:hypothetical protein
LIKNKPLTGAFKRWQHRQKRGFLVLDVLECDGQQSTHQSYIIAAARFYTALLAKFKERTFLLTQAQVCQLKTTAGTDFYKFAFALNFTRAIISF